MLQSHNTLSFYNISNETQTNVTTVTFQQMQPIRSDSYFMTERIDVLNRGPCYCEVLTS